MTERLTLRQAALAPPAAALRLLRALRLARSVRRERVALAALGPALLRDVGLTQEAAAAEAARPAWDLPPARRE